MDVVGIDDEITAAGSSIFGFSRQLTFGLKIVRALLWADRYSKGFICSYLAIFVDHFALLD